MNNHTEEQTQDKDIYEQEAVLKAFIGTLHHFFGGWQSIFKDITDPRNLNLITYQLTGLLCTGVLMYVFRLGSRREVNNILRGNGPSQAKFGTWFDVDTIPHGDTLNYCFKKVDPDEVQKAVNGMVNTLIRKKVLDHWRLFGHFLIAIDGTGMLTFRERHSPKGTSVRALSDQETEQWGDPVLSPSVGSEASDSQWVRFLYHDRVHREYRSGCRQARL